MPRGVGYEQAFEGLYGRRGGSGRRDDRRMRQRFLECPGMLPGFVPCGLNPRNPNPMFAQPRINPVNSGQSQGPPSSMDEVKKWVIETCGGHLEEATGSMKIRGIPDDIPQFVVHKPATQLQTVFKDRKSRLGSMLMFHGTPLPNLQPILQGGFRPGVVWVAREPSWSIGFALKGQRHAGRPGGMAGGYRDFMTLPQIEKLLQSPYCSYGALLGCEYVEATGQWTGRGRGVGPPRVRAGGGMQLGTACTYDHHAVMVRYVFLIPPDSRNGMYRVTWNAGRGLGNLGQMGEPPFPTRSQIRTQMLENMENIERRIERRTIEG
jgi:hypothetical protein